MPNVIFQEISVSREEPQRSPHHRFHPRSLKNQTRHLTESLQHVRLSLPEVIVPSFFGNATTEASASQSSYSLPIIKQRSSSRTRPGSEDIGGSSSDSPPLSGSPRNRLTTVASSHSPQFQFPQPSYGETASYSGNACSGTSQNSFGSGHQLSATNSNTSPLLQGTPLSASSEAVSPIGKFALFAYTLMHN